MNGPTLPQWDKKKSRLETKTTTEKNKKGKELWPNFHSLRASYIMNLLTAQDGAIPHVVVQQMAGHASWDTTAHYVAKLTPEEIKDVSTKLNPYKKKRKSG